MHSCRPIRARRRADLPSGVGDVRAVVGVLSLVFFLFVAAGSPLAAFSLSDSAGRPAAPPRRTPVALPPGVVIGYPFVAKDAPAPVGDLSVACGLYLTVAVAGRPAFGQTPCPLTPWRVGWKASYRFRPADAATVLRRCGATHLAVGTLSGGGDHLRLRYQWYRRTGDKGKAAVAVGPPFVVQGTPTALARGLPTLAAGLAKALGDSPGVAPFAPGMTADEMTTLGGLSRAANWTAGQQATAIRLADRSPLAALYLVGVASGLDDASVRRSTDRALTALPENAVVWSLVTIQHPGLLTPRRATLAALQKRYPACYQFAQARAWLERGAGDRAAERSAGELAVRAAPGNPDAYLSLGKTLGQAADDVRQARFYAEIPEKNLTFLEETYQAWMKTVRRATELDPDHGIAYLRLATAATFAGEPELAEKAFNRALVLAPEIGEVYTWGMQMFQPKWGGDPDKLKEVAATAAKAAASRLDSPTVLALSQTMAYLKLDAERNTLLANALAAGDARVKANPNDVGGIYLRAIALNQQKKTEEAIAAYKQVTVVQPWYYHGWYDLGYYLSHLGRYAEAVPALEKAHELNPPDADVACELGTAYWHVDRLDDAAKVAKGVVEANPKSAYGWDILGSVYFKQKKTEEALAAYKKTVALSRFYPDAYDNLGHLYIDRKDWPAAIDAYKNLASLRSDDLYPMVQLGYVYEENKQFRESEIACRYVLERDDKNAIAHDNLGIALAGLGRIDEARKEWKRSLELGGPPDMVKEAQEYLAKYPEKEPAKPNP